jgi:hypothetical protein
MRYSVRAPLVKRVQGYFGILRSRFTDKEKLWEAKAAKMHMTVKHLKGWFWSLQDKNTRFLLFKHKSRDDAPRKTETDRCVLSNFRFLQEVVRHRKRPARSILPSSASAAVTLRRSYRYMDFVSESLLSYLPDLTQQQFQDTKKIWTGGGEHHPGRGDGYQAKESEATLKSLVQSPAVTNQSTATNYMRESLLTMLGLKFKKTSILARLMHEDPHATDIWKHWRERGRPSNFLRCRSAPPLVITLTYPIYFLFLFLYIYK